MLAALFSLVLLPQAGAIQRDAYGVPLVTAQTEQEAFYWFGRAVAEDRLWQMELSRRLARAQLAEVMGRGALASDRDVAKTGYTDEELQRQIDAMPERVRDAFQNYARGVNDTIDARKQEGTLPDGYTSLGFEPREWTPLDSAAIAVRLLRQFGKGGAGELRNYALYLYLKAQPCGESVLDVVDDLAWQNDPRSVPTVRPEEDPLATRHPRFPSVSRRQTEAHIASLPRTNLLELLPAIRMATGAATDLIAEQIGAPWKFGSYAVVVGPERSKTGYPLLLSAPQMGHGDPSVIHEIAIVSPGLNVAGIDVPGVPAVIVGHTPDLAWGLTSGVADIEDVFFSRLVDENTYLYGEEERSLIHIERTILVKGSDPVTVEVVRTHHGPVILTSRAGNAVFSLQSSFWNKELGGIAALFDLYGARDSGDVERFVAKVPVSFNFFFATTRGEYGFRYAGLVPYRATGYDPRFPTPSGPDSDWQGYVSTSSMPRVLSPPSGLIANWNNKPASWWPNFDTPAWGYPFRNEVLLRAVDKPKIGRFDLERAAWEIARRETVTSGVFISDFKAVLDAESALGQLSDQARYLGSYEGWNVEGSVGAVIYAEAVKELREELFKQHTGTFLQQTLFEAVVQPSVIRKALRGETAYDFLAGREPFAVLKTAIEQAMANLRADRGDDPSAWAFSPGKIAVKGQSPIPYSNRGTYIQIVELSGSPVGRSVASPGVSEAGEHSSDQAALARAWTFKPMWRLGG